VTVLLLRLVVAGVFLYAGSLKAMNPALFAKDVDNFQMLPLAAAASVAAYLPWLEVLTGFALIVNVWLRGALLVSAGMLLAFVTALGAAWGSGLDLTCGCFGHGSGKTNYPLSLLLDGALLAAVCFIAWRTVRAESRE
jgi:uncharacterized membrane protein YphA (DoxX/SURF4 family)